MKTNYESLSHWRLTYQQLVLLLGKVWVDIVRNLSLEDVKYQRKEFEFYKMKDADPAISRKQLLLFLTLHS